MTDLLRAVIADPATLAEFDRLEARYKYLAKRLPWTDDDFNEMTAIHRQMFVLSIQKPAGGEIAA